MRQTIGAALALAALRLGAASAAPPDYPVHYIHLDELKALLDRRDRVDLSDVRPWGLYVHGHIKGARSYADRVGGRAGRGGQPDGVGRLRLNVPARAVPGGAQHSLRARGAEPARLRRGTRGLDGQGLPGRGHDGRPAAGTLE